MHNSHEHMQTTGSNQRFRYSGKVRRGLEDVTFDLSLDKPESGEGFYIIDGMYPIDVNVLSRKLHHEDQSVEYIFETKVPMRKEYTAKRKIILNQNGNVQISYLGQY